MEVIISSLELGLGTSCCPINCKKEGFISSFVSLDSRFLLFNDQTLKVMMRMFLSECKIQIICLTCSTAAVMISVGIFDVMLCITY